MIEDGVLPVSEETMCTNTWSALADDPAEARGSCTWHLCDRWHVEGDGVCVCGCGSMVLSMPIHTNGSEA